MRPLLASLALALVLLAGPASAALPPQPFTDPVGDTFGLGPDVRGATASSDGAGEVAVEVDLVAPLADGDTLQLEVDADAEMNGAPGGYDLNFTYADGVGRAYRWSGTAWTEVPAHSLAVEASGSTVTFRFARADFAIVDAVRFVVLGTAGGTEIGEQAPDSALGWTFYDASAPSEQATAPTEETTTALPALTAAPPPAVTGLSVPRSVRAGGWLVVRLRLRGVPAVGGKVTCSARTGGKPLAARAALAARATLAAGAAACTWRLPRTARGTLAGTVSVAYPGFRASRPFAVRVAA